MKKVPVVAALSLVLLAMLWTVPAADAGSRVHRGSGGGRFGGGHSFQKHGHSFHSHRRAVPSHSFHSHPFGHRRFFTPHFGSFGVVLTPPLVVYSSPPVFYTPPLHYSTPVYAPVVYSPPAYSQTPPPRVVEYPTGWYELRGDGVTTPYTWVWIPRPPPPPPADAPTSEGPRPVRRAQLYRWVDEQGAVHLTDSLETVPPEHRRPSVR